MAKLRVQNLQIGAGDLSTNLDSEFTSGAIDPISANGKDGDVYVKVAGANSSIFIKKNGQWVSLISTPVTVSLPDNTTNFVWLTLPASFARFFNFTYGISRASTLRGGDLNLTSDGSANVSATDFGTAAPTADPGVVFDGAISGSNLNFLATTTSTGVGATLEYVLNSMT